MFISPWEKGIPTFRDMTPGQAAFGHFDLELDALAKYQIPILRPRDTEVKTYSIPKRRAYWPDAAVKKLEKAHRRKALRKQTRKTQKR